MLKWFSKRIYCSPGLKSEPGLVLDVCCKTIPNSHWI